MAVADDGRWICNEGGSIWVVILILFGRQSQYCGWFSRMRQSRCEWSMLWPIDSGSAVVCGIFTDYDDVNDMVVKERFTPELTGTHWQELSTRTNCDLNSIIY